MNPNFKFAMPILVPRYLRNIPPFMSSLALDTRRQRPWHSRTPRRGDKFARTDSRGDELHVLLGTHLMMVLERPSWQNDNPGLQKMLSPKGTLGSLRGIFYFSLQPFSWLCSRGGEHPPFHPWLAWRHKDVTGGSRVRGRHDDQPQRTVSLWLGWLFLKYSGISGERTPPMLW